MALVRGERRGKGIAHRVRSYRECGILGVLGMARSLLGWIGVSSCPPEPGEDACLVRRITLLRSSSQTMGDLSARLR